MTADFKTMRKASTRAERIIPVCLRGDLLADHELLRQELRDAEAASGDSMERVGVGELNDRIKAVEAEIRENTYRFRLRAMSNPDWRAFIAAHPPRRGDDGEIVEADKSLELNTETFYDDLVRVSIVDPDPADDATWEEIRDSLTDYQYQEFAEAAWNLNRREVSIPLSPAGSPTRRDSGGG